MYRLKNKRFEYPAGITVYEFRGHDYGCSNEDSLIFQEPHVTVTAQPDGGIPFFTVPEKDIELI